jgi:thioredoxin reductase (NADPH)
VTGGGNTAVEEALYLARHAARVTLIHRRGQLRAEEILQHRLRTHPNVHILWNSAVDEIVGERDPARVTGVRIRDTQTGATNVLSCDGVFVAVGHLPATELYRGQIAINADGYVITRPGSTATSVPGVFAASDVADQKYRQAVTAAGAGCMAALDAQQFLAAASNRNPLSRIV